MGSQDDGGEAAENRNKWEKVTNEDMSPQNFQCLFIILITVKQNELFTEIEYFSCVLLEIVVIEALGCFPVPQIYYNS